MRQSVKPQINSLLDFIQLTLKGLDNEPTIEEILEVNNQVDNKGDRGGPNPGDSQGDSGGDSLKSPSDKGNGKGSNSELTNRESKIDLVG